ncbi:MAG TPA: dihydrofolate reductase family protein [Candidatus Sulfomarinibacteraceae bacterium]|nr:dihydrofolate reductase family protein [Candidatus Sulfomarinibacteraceae bacterium]
MGKVKADISMSLDGYIAGPNAGPEQPLGEGGERLHQWVYRLESWREQHGLEGGEASRDSEIQEEAFRNVGAVLMGRRMFDEGEEPWGDNPPFHVPVFVLTHNPREKLVKEGGTTFTFVSDGIESGLRQAREAAGERDIAIAGGASAIQQYLKAGLLDEIQIHLAPVLLGAGNRLFDGFNDEHIELERLRVVDSPTVTHLKYRVCERA